MAFFKAPRGLSLFYDHKKDRVRFQSFPKSNFFLSFFSRRHLSFIFNFLPKTSPGQFIFFDFTPEIEKPLVDWLIISCKPRPSSRVLIAWFRPRDQRAPGWLAQIFATPLLINNRLKHRSSPVSFTVWSGTRIGSEGQQRQQHGIRAKGARARQQQQRRRDVNGADFATETEKGEFSWAQHRNNNSHNMADGGCSTTSTTTVTAIRTTSTVEENDVDEKSRRQQRAQQQQRPQRGDRLRRDRAETGDNSTNAWSVPSCNEDFNKMDHSVRLFRFLLVVLSIFLASPQGTTNFCDTGSNPSSATFFSP